MTQSLPDLLRQRIEREGPLRLDAFMAKALGHPTLGYYTSGRPIGLAGDFITAPEISPMFGELIGLWCAHTWTQMGAPDPVHLVELGPGRGTLMADALRAIARAAPAFRRALQVHLVETSPTLRQEQAKALPDASPAWHDTLDTVPEGPLLVIANEFFDALPIRQARRIPGGWSEMHVGLDENNQFALVNNPRPSPVEALIPPDIRVAPEGSVFEFSPASWTVMQTLSERIIRNGGAALIIDYGHTEHRLGATLQAIKSHQKVSALEEPGSRDLTAHVDFAALARVAQESKARVYGPAGQGAFLETLGIHARAAQIKAAAPDQASVVASALHRLTASTEMGTLFQVMGISAPTMPPLAGFLPD